MRHARLQQIAVAVLIAAFVALGVSGVFSSQLGMSPPAAVAFTIMLIAATLWVSEAIPLFVTSFIILALCSVWLIPALGEQGVVVEQSVFLTPFFSNIILLFLGGFVISSAMHKHALDEQAARWVMARTRGSISALLAGLMGITALLSMFLSNTATAAMMLALVLPILRQMPAGDPGRKAILLCIPLGANVGGLGTPIGTPPNAIALQYLDHIGMAPGFGQWMLMSVPLVLIMLGVIWLLLRVLFRGGVALVDTPEAVRQPHPFSPKRIYVVGVSLLTVIGWLTSRYHGLPLGTVALLPVIGFFGPRVLEIKDFRTLSWDVLMIMGGGLCLGVAMSKSGLAGWFIAQLPTETLGYLVLMVLLGGVACLMSSLMSNTATANLLMPIVVGLHFGGVEGHADQVGPMLLVTAFCCSMAMALPISTPPNAIAFSAGELTVRDMLKIGLPVTVIGVGLVLTVGLWWWRLVGVM